MRKRTHPRTRYVSKHKRFEVLEPRKKLVIHFSYVLKLWGCETLKLIEDSMWATR